MKKILIPFLTILFFAVSCGTPSAKKDGKVITVTIPPLAWFVEGIAGGDFDVSIMLPQGADHHIWEPLPAQISALAASKALVMDGQIDFERAWLDRFREINPDMRILDLSRHIELIRSGHEADSADNTHYTGYKADGNDPHYWMSPVSAYIIADDIKNFLTELNPGSAEKYEHNLTSMNDTIARVDSLLRQAASSASPKTFMIYHPALGYVARDYGLEQISFEDEGKSPSPARMKELIDIAGEKRIHIIFIQAEYDIRNAQSLSSETGAKLVVINPMNKDWPRAVMEVARVIGSGEM
jgi:zinc transport system substrate-binding protein